MLSSEKELVRRLKRGDASAFHELVDQFGQRLFGLAYSLLGNAADAEDVVQETLAGASRGLRWFEQRSSLWTWLTRVLVKQIARHRRWLGSRPAMRLDAAQAQDQSAARSEGLRVGSAAAGVDARVDLAAALEALKPEHREVIILREMEQMSYEQMAEALDVPRGTIESRLHRARAELRRLLADYQD